MKKKQSGRTANQEDAEKQNLSQETEQAVLEC